MSLVCVLGSFRASVCAFRVSELLVVRLSFVAKLFCLRCVSCEIPKFSCEFRIRVFVSYFEVDSRIRFFEFSKSYFEFVFFASLLYSISRISIFDSNFEFKFLEFSCRISNSSFSLRCSIRLLEFRFESFVALFDFSNFDSKVSLLYSTSRISLL